MKPTFYSSLTKMRKPLMSTVAEKDKGHKDSSIRKHPYIDVAYACYRQVSGPGGDAGDGVDGLLRGFGLSVLFRSGCCWALQRRIYDR
jgi:hypothetical protein